MPLLSEIGCSYRSVDGRTLSVPGTSTLDPIAYRESGLLGGVTFDNKNSPGGVQGYPASNEGFDRQAEYKNLPRLRKNRSLRPRRERLWDKRD